MCCFLFYWIIYDSIKGIIFFLLDPKVQVVYVSPVKLSEEVYQYYHKLLGMKAQSSYSDHSDINQTPNDEDNEDFESRYKVVVPDAVDRFPVSMYVCYVCMYSLSFSISVFNLHFMFDVPV